MNTDIFRLRLLKASEVAKIMNVSRAHVYNLIAKGLLPSVWIGGSRRIRPQDLEAFINDNLTAFENPKGLK